MYPEFDYLHFFTHNILMYKLLGFWRPDKEMKYKMLYHCYTATCTAVWVAYLLSQITYISTNIQNVSEVTATLFVTITFSMDLIKMLVIYRNMNYIKLLIKNLNNPIFQVKCAKHYEIATNAKTINKILFYYCFCLGWVTDTVWAIVPFLGDEKTTLVRGWFPYDETKPIGFTCTYIFQTVETVWNTMLCLNLDTFTGNLLIQIGLQCDLLCATLESLEDFHVVDGILDQNTVENKLALLKDNNKFSETMLENLIVCITHHREIMRMAKNIENIHKTSVFVLFTGGAVTLCSCLFQLSMVTVGTTEFFMLLCYLLAMLTEQFIYCWFGNEVIYKSSLILQSAYNTPWLQCNIKFQKVLLQFMTQTYRPISLKAGGLFTMSILVYISILKTSYSYFTLLKKIQ
nr:odorant receptor [Semanotus bifasciatus]